ncbi:MAG: DUF2868 domain-containing protein [Planctomycetes bacterium]|nr:DUF2868 domain-containing protein [Planctomycetota bacterium]
MDLARLVDLEVQLQRDDRALAEGRANELEARDAAIGGALLAQGGRLDAATAMGRQQLAAAWLDALGETGPRLGHRATHALRVAAWLLGLAAGLVGIGAARATLAYDGQQPVNVFGFLAVLIGLQMVLLAAMVVALLRGGDSVAARLVAWAARRWPGGHAALGAGQIAGRLQLHAAAERWHLFALNQRAAIAFNLGALATCLYLVVFTDLAFGWSTTLELGAEQMHRLCGSIAAPWRQAWPDAVPSLELVRDSQWTRMPGRFTTGAALPTAVQQSGRWWSFLVAALLVWGLLPRLLAWAFAAHRARRTLANLPLDDRRCAALFARLLPPAAAWSGPAPEAIGLPAAARLGNDRARPVPAVAHVATWLLCWGRLQPRQDAVRDLVARSTGTDPVGVGAVGGSALADDAAAVARLAAAQVQRVLLVLSAGTQPTKDVLELLATLRQRLGPRAHLGVALLADANGQLAPADAAELRPWQARLDRLGDANLGVERLEVPGHA